MIFLINIIQQYVFLKYMNSVYRACIAMSSLCRLFDNILKHNPIVIISQLCRYVKRAQMMTIYNQENTNN